MRAPARVPASTPTCGSALDEHAPGFRADDDPRGRRRRRPPARFATSTASRRADSRSRSSRRRRPDRSRARSGASRRRGQSSASSPRRSTSSRREGRLWSVLTPRRSRTASRLAPKPSPAGKPTLPLRSDVVGRPERRRVVDDRAAAEAGAGDQADALVVGRRRPATAVEAPEAGPLGAVEVALRPVAARLEHDDVQPRRREHGRGDAPARARADHTDVALQLQPGTDVERREARRGRVVARLRAVRGSRSPPTGREACTRTRAPPSAAPGNRCASAAPGCRARRAARPRAEAGRAARTQAARCGGAAAAVAAPARSGRARARPGRPPAHLARRLRERRSRRSRPASARRDSTSREPLGVPARCCKVALHSM